MKGIHFCTGSRFFLSDKFTFDFCVKLQTASMADVSGAIAELVNPLLRRHHNKINVYFSALSELPTDYLFRDYYLVKKRTKKFGQCPNSNVYFRLMSSLRKRDKKGESVSLVFMNLSEKFFIVKRYQQQREGWWSRPGRW